MASLRRKKSSHPSNLPGPPLQLLQSRKVTPASLMGSSAAPGDRAGMADAAADDGERVAPGAGRGSDGDAGLARDTAGDAQEGGGTAPAAAYGEQGSFSQVLKDSARLLPHQAILENFVHRNPLEVLQDMDFFEAQAHMRKVLSYPSPGARMAALVRSDPRKRANSALVELAAVFLDRGAAKWAAPYRERGFLYFFAEMEGAALTPTLWRSHARATARRVLQTLKRDSLDDSAASHLAQEIILENLQALGTPAVEVGSMLTAMLFDMQGYAAMFQRMEQHPEEAPVSASSPSGRIRVRLVDFAAVHSTLQRASIEALARESVRNFCTLWLSGAAYAIALRASASFANAFA